MTEFVGDTYIYDGRVAMGNVVSTAVPFAHSALSGLSVDDHLQYHTDARGDARYAPLSSIYGFVRTAADSTGVLDATVQLQADLATAVAAGHNRLYLPSGTYKVSKASGAVFALISADVEVFGDGIGKTIIKYADSQTLTSNVSIFRLSGNDQIIRDISFVGGAGMTYGAFISTAIEITAGAFRSHIHDCEMSGFEGGGTAGGGGITLYQPWNQIEISTTLGTVIVAGVRTVTPASMAGIYPGRRLSIGGASEVIVVTSVTVTTFTATFANAHGSSDSVTAFSQGHQYAVIERCFIHDCYLASAIVINSSANVVRDCRIVRVGSNSVQHGLYIQGGQNLIEGNYIEGVGGYSIHGHKVVPNTDASGDRYSDNTSVNPGYCHIIVDRLSSDGTNPEIPSGQYLTQYATIQGNVCRNTNLHTSEGIRCEAPCAVIGNLLEDVYQTAGGAWIDTFTVPGSTIASNILRTTNPPTSGVNNYYIRANNAAVTGNQIDCIATTGTYVGMQATGGCVVTGNRIVMSGSTAHRGLSISGDNNIVIGNYIDAGAGNALVLGSSNLFVVANNSLIGGFVTNANLIGVNGEFRDNTFGVAGMFRYTNAHAGFRLRNNHGQVSYNGAGAIALTSEAGLLIACTTDGAAQTEGRLVKIASGVLSTLALSDTVFFGVLVQATPASAVGAYVAAQVGAIVLIAADGAWTAGNIGVPSTTSAGKVHDSASTTPPASGSYGVFLDTGGGAGNARVLLVKTL